MLCVLNDIMTMLDSCSVYTMQAREECSTYLYCICYSIAYWSLAQIWFKNLRYFMMSVMCCYGDIPSSLIRFSVYPHEQLSSWLTFYDLLFVLHAVIAKLVVWSHSGAKPSRFAGFQVLCIKTTKSPQTCMSIIITERYSSSRRTCFTFIWTCHAKTW